MKIKATMLSFATMLALAPAAGWAAPGDGLAGTHHDFSGGTATTGGEAFTTGVCTFCHTPHKAITTSLLWNHTLSTATFSWDITKTTAGTNFPTFKGDTYKGPSAKCLSCHDGSVAVGDIAWFGEGKPNTIDVGGVEMTTHYHGAGDPMNVGLGGSMAGNHPVAMPYPYLNGANTYNGVTTGLQAALGEWQATPTGNIRIFNDDGSGVISAGAVPTKTGIECSSCHDPHNKAAVDDLFLRGKLSGNTNADGYLCLQCHIK